MISMDRNTSPKSPLTPAMIEAAFSQLQLQHYPDQEGAEFKKLYAKFSGLDPQQLELANGSDEWIQKAVLTLGYGGVLAFAPDFGMYEVYCQQAGLPFMTVAADADFNFSVPALVERIQLEEPSLCILSNPQNPTGVCFSGQELAEIATEMKAVDGYLVIDECYAEFAPAYERPQGDHILYFRTLSKIYGLAGLRIGIVIGQGEAFERINGLNHPYPVNSLATTLASQLFMDVAHLETFVAEQKACQQALFKAFEGVGDLVELKPSQTNFIFTYGERALDLANFLKRAGFQGRTYEGDPLLGQAARYSVIDLADIPALEAAIKNWRTNYV